MPSKEVRVGSFADSDPAARLSVLAMDLACQPDPVEVGARITELAVKLISCAAVDITEVSMGQLLIPASSDRALSALTKVVWQRWTPASSVDGGVAGTRAATVDPGYVAQLLAYCRISDERLYELRVGDVSYGNLRFLLRADDFISAADDELAAAFATHAAIALDRAALLMKVSNLQTAIDTNREIGAAVGILMARQVIGYPEGFKLLLQISQNDNRKLRDVAAEVVHTGALPQQRFGRTQQVAATVPSRTTGSRQARKAPVKRQG